MIEITPEMIEAQLKQVNPQFALSPIPKVQTPIEKLQGEITSFKQEVVAAISTGMLKGERGPAGKNGINGRDGRDGLDGRDGRDGVDGKDGKDGKDGVSVIGANIHFDGSLVLSLSNGDIIDCGPITIDTGNKTYLTNIPSPGATGNPNTQLVNDLGAVTGTFPIDMNFGRNIGTVSGGSVYITIDNPSAGEETVCYFDNTSTTTATQIYFNTANVTFVGTTADYVILEANQTGIFTITTNDGTNFFCFVNTTFYYPQTESGLITTYNSSYKDSDITLANSNRQFTWTTSSGVGLVRAFGGKNTGKWRFAVYIDQTQLDSTSYDLKIGIADVNLLSSQEPGDSAQSFAVGHFGGSGATYPYRKINGGTSTTIGSNVSIPVGTILGFLVDLDAGKFWITVNGSVIGGGNPEAGTGADYTTLSIGGTYYPVAGGKVGTSPTTLGIKHTIVNEVTDTYASTWPSFSLWTS